MLTTKRITLYQMHDRPDLRSKKPEIRQGVSEGTKFYAACLAIFTADIAAIVLIWLFLHMKGSL